MAKLGMSASSSILAISLVLTGCAAPRGSSNGSASSGDSCGTWLVVGAIGGLLTQRGSKGSKAGGALVGGAAAYALCKAVSNAKYTVNQTKTEQQVKDEYVRSGRPLPTASSISAHRLSISQARGQDQKGSPVTFINVRSDISVLSGSQGSPRVEEQVVLIAPDGQTKLGDIRKTTGSSGGGYGAVTQISMPDGLEDGQYEIRHVVLLDGSAKSQRVARFSYVAGIPSESPNITSSVLEFKPSLSVL